MTLTRHEFLALLHAELKPRKYLEVGVQYGTSLNLAATAEVAIGIDPLPLCRPHGNQQIFSMTGDDFFQYMGMTDWIDLAFIDGSHLFEDALRDFINIEMHSHPGTVVVFDDVLPTTQEMTSRTMVPGHWTGDVWKLYQILNAHRKQLRVLLVDTEPTGTMLVYGLDSKDQTLAFTYKQIIDEYMRLNTAPNEILERSWALPPSMAVEHMKNYLEAR